MLKDEELIVMPLKELFRAINVIRLNLELPLVTEDRFIEDITVMQMQGKVEIKDGMVTAK
jgi:hypothetical protein